MELNDRMLASFLESIKYVGHLIPIAFLRIFVGSIYFQSALIKFQSDFLVKPKLASEVAEVLPTLLLPVWYKELVEAWLVTRWQSFGFVWMALEFAIGISFVLGYVVRPIAILAAFLSFQFLIIHLAPGEAWHRLLFVLHLAFAWVGAGRCLGIDYYFYKRQRGWWW